MLPPPLPSDTGRKLLVLDLDETLVHSSFKPVPKCDFVVPVEIEGLVHQVYVRKRPRVDQFMKRMGELYEIVVFTASLGKYAHPVCDEIDPLKTIRHRLFREHCSNHLGNYVKDLSKLGRDLTQIIIIDNSAVSYLFQPQNALAISSWFDDDSDMELEIMTPFLEKLATQDSVYPMLARAAKEGYVL
jgi:RNA polymerase II subunit A small phosphatase-like protein